eukprot:scaffold358739_cov20-Prasinocladus_malaysianus.AAC.1
MNEWNPYTEGVHTRALGLYKLKSECCRLASSMKKTCQKSCKQVSHNEADPVQLSLVFQSVCSRKVDGLFKDLELPAASAAAFLLRQ